MVCKHNLKKLFTPLCGRGRQQSAVKITGTAFQAGDIFGVIVGSVILPATPHDSLPFEGQRADRRLATLAATSAIDSSRSAEGLSVVPESGVMGAGALDTGVRRGIASVAASFPISKICMPSGSPAIRAASSGFLPR